MSSGVDVKVSEQLLHAFMQLCGRAIVCVSGAYDSIVKRTKAYCVLPGIGSVSIFLDLRV